MPITYTSGAAGNPFQQPSPVATDALSLTAGQVVTVGVVISDVGPAGILSISDNVGDMTWTLVQDASAASACRVAVWIGVVPTTATRTVSVAWDSGGNLTRSIYWQIHTGANTGAPLGSNSKGTAASSVTYPVTPASNGSALWMLAADANGVSAQTMTAGANCTIDQQQTPDVFAAALIRPTTQPRTSAATFSLAETHTGSGVSWVGWEVKEASSQSQSPRSMHLARMRLGI